MGKRIAVVDDDVSVCKGVSRLLRSAGYQTLSFSSGEECLATDHLSQVDCFLVDIHMGGMNGIDLSRVLRGVGIIAPVIFMTAQDEGATREALTAAGSPLCLRKPMGSETLLGAISGVLPGTV